MKQVLLAALFAATVASPAYAMTYYLQAQWLDGGNRFCRYSNGTVLNVGYRICPLSIQG
ncbi:MAG: hypothetical protein ACJ8EB_00310 [Allosphingosinicella sp.]